ncbi:MAG: serine hydrolase domain-containing protein [Allomuricauda sp.]
MISLFLSSTASYGQELPELNELINHERTAKGTPAIAVAVIDSAQIVHLSATGYRDLAKKSKVDTDSPFHICSVSKTVTNMAIFKLVEAGKIDLDADINDYVSFSIRNPHYPKDRITVRDLLNHRSGIKDNFDIYGPYWNNPQGDPKIELNDFLRNYLAPDGKLYSKEHFDSKTDYKSFKYSNTGIALLALLIENVSQQSFETFCQKEIFKPMEMNNTSWFLKNLNPKHVVKTYTTSDNGKPLFRGHNGYPDYPAGQLRTSIADFSKLMTGYLNASDSNFVLAEETVHKITPNPNIAHQGYFTWYLTAINDRLYYYHEGGDTGARTVVLMDVIRKNAIIIFTNAEHNLEPLLREIENQMWNS